jgi:hypothetical protein
VLVGNFHIDSKQGFLLVLLEVLQLLLLLRCRQGSWIKSRKGAGVGAGPDLDAHHGLLFVCVRVCMFFVCVSVCVRVYVLCV